MDSPGYTRRLDFDEIQYEGLINVGIAAVKGGDRQQARKLLTKATEMKPGDPQPWLWLSATTDDPAEKREYLGYALAADPGNGAARRGLVLLSGELDKSRLLDEGEGVLPRFPSEPEDAQAVEAFLCPQCGGRMLYNSHRHGLVCESCGHIKQTSGLPAGDSAEQVLDFILPTTRGHRWAEAQHRLSCAQCGAVTLMQVGERVNQCPYCGSGQIIASAETGELVDPQVVAPARMAQEEAVSCVRKWLGRGLFAPDDLKKLARAAALRPAYYPFWTFDGTLELHWTCEISEGGDDDWVARDGVELENFDDVVVPGLHRFSRQELTQIEPFALKDVVVFDPACLAGWSALAYDKPLSEATLEARELVVHKLRSELNSRVLIGHNKRNMKSGQVQWSGMTFKHVLLPLWLGAYRYKGREYRLLVNDQTGKVGGQKPHDDLKIAAFIVLIVFTILVFLLVSLLVGLNFGWFSLSILSGY